MITVIIDGCRCAAVSSKTLVRYDSSSLSDISSGRSSSRVMLRLPSTAETDALFGNAANPLSAVRFNDSAHRAEVWCDGVRMMAGTPILHGVRRSGGETLYVVEVRSDTALWARSAALRKLSDASVSYSGCLVPEEICAGWSGGSAVKFFPVNRTARQTVGSSVSLLPAQKAMTTDDYWPFISAEALVRAIFGDAGYSIESRFMESELFRSLYISGSYKVPDAASRKRTMDFLAGRTSDATATANYFGRVYMTPSVGVNSVGNIVDTTVGYVTDDDGKTSATGFFSTGGCFFVDEESGVATFRPTTPTVLGFEYSIAYATDHIISSRTELTGFDTVYLGNGSTVRFALANRYDDHREEPLPGYGYSLIIFDYDSAYVYRLAGKVGGKQQTIETDIRSTYF